LLELVHVFAYFLVDEFGVVLYGGDAPETEHFGDTLNRHSVAECYGGGKRVTCNVEGEILGNVALRRNLLEGIVEVLVAGNWKYGRLRMSRGYVGMQTLDDLQRQMHQRHIAIDTRLLSLGADPVAVALSHDVLYAQVLEVNVGKAGETGKHKHRARAIEVTCGQRSYHDALQFFFVEDFAIDRVDANLESHERIARGDVARPGHPKHGLQGLDVLHSGVVTTPALGAHVHFKVFQEDEIQLVETDVVALVMLHQIIGQMRSAT